MEYKGEYASSWDELTADQLLFVSGLFNLSFSLETFNVLVLQFFTKLPWNMFFKIKTAYILEMSDTISFLHKNIDLTENKFPVIKSGSKKLYGPSDKLMDLTFEQFFGHTEPAFTAYAQNNDNEMLSYLVAALYSFEKGKFNPDLIEKNILLMPKISDKQKTAVSFFYAGCRDLLAGQFPKLFSAKKTSGLTGISYFEMIENLNNENVSNNEKVKQANLYESLTRLTGIIEKAENIKNTNR
jgi:hypothetical protein